MKNDPINEVIIFLASDWSLGQLDDDMTNNISYNFIKFVIIIKSLELEKIVIEVNDKVFQFFIMILNNL